MNNNTNEIELDLYRLRCKANELRELKVSSEFQRQVREELAKELEGIADDIKSHVVDLLS